ncbi:MAG: hypothetical protein DRQ43_04810 [Gammaproteobacteria bacterium]|nr:MAG: hypothetical protein DRQ43_04810 [Gammaproteobacteria bacterium]
MIIIVSNNLPDSNTTDPGLEVLLQLDNEIFPMENGFWTKFEAKQVVVNEHIPHGIKYSLTLHDPSNTRILGYDNAHGIKPKKKKYGAKRVIWDHRHEKKIVEPYEFENAGQLMEDFWADVERIISELHR